MERKEAVVDVAAGAKAKTIVSLSVEDCGALLTQNNKFEEPQYLFGYWYWPFKSNKCL